MRSYPCDSLAGQAIVEVSLVQAFNGPRESMKKHSERKPSFTNSSGIEIRPFYASRDLQDLDVEADIGFPGELPLTRGIQPTMYRSRLWTMRQYAGFGSPKE